MVKNRVATLELQMIADVARLQKDMRAMERIVGDATGKAGASFNNAGKAAAGYAADVQKMASQASGVRGALNSVTASAGAQRAGMQQLSYQISDVASTFALGINPMVIFAQQGGQVVQALAMMRGSAGGLVGFLAGPWGAAFMGAVTVAGLLIPKLLDTSKAMDDVKFSSSAVGDAQGILGGVLDMTTGKVNNQSAALLGLAQAQLAVARVQAQARQIEAKAGVRSMQDRQMAIRGGMGGGFWFEDQQPGAAKAISAEVLAGRIAPKDAVQRLDNLRKAGALTEEAWLKATQAVTNFSVEGENIKVFESAQRMLDGVGNAVDRNLLLKPQRAARATKKAVEEIKIHPLDQAVIDAWVNVQKLSADANAKSLEYGKGMETVGEKMIQQAKDKAALDDAAQEGAQQMLDLYLQQLAVLQQMGGAAGTVGGILAGLATGNFSGVNGKLGRLLGGVGLSVGQDGWKDVTDKLDEIFGSAGDGSFGKTMQKLFAAGGMGTLAGSLANGSGNSGVGSFAGGAIGEKLGEKFLSKGMESIMGGLGQFAGPLGAIAGGILGGALGGLLKKAKWGTSVVTGQNAGDVSSAGNKAAYKSNAGLAGTSIQSGLDAIAEQFGADVGGYNVSIGQYKGKWRVSSTGRSGKLKGKYGDVTDFGEDGAEDAIKYAIADAIKDGALIGLRASTQALLAASDDVEAQLQKALQFEGVFSELKSMTDPMGYALETLDKSFDQLRTVFAEAGATTAEYAELEQLYQLKRVEAIKEANSEADALSRDRRTLEARILELQGRDIESVAMMRQIEMEQMEASLRSLQQRVWAMEDATAIIEEMQPFVDSLKSYRDTLFGVGDGAMSYQASLVKLMTTGGLAAAGDKVALGDLQGVSADFLTASKDNARSLTQYQRDVAMVARYVDGGIGAAQEQIDYAKLTLDAQDATVALLTSIDASLRGSSGAVVPQAAAQASMAGVAANDDAALLASEEVVALWRGIGSDLSLQQRDIAALVGAVVSSLGIAKERREDSRLALAVQDATAEWRTSIDARLTGGAVGLGVATPPVGVGIGAMTPGLIEPQMSSVPIGALIDEVKGMRAESHAQNLRIAENTNRIERLMSRWDGDGLLVRGEADSPIDVSDAA